MLAPLHVQRCGPCIDIANLHSQHFGNPKASDYGCNHNQPRALRANDSRVRYGLQELRQTIRPAHPLRALLLLFPDPHPFARGAAVPEVPLRGLREDCGKQVAKIHTRPPSQALTLNRHLSAAALHCYCLRFRLLVEPCFDSRPGNLAKQHVAERRQNVVLKVSPILRLSRRTQLRNAGVFEFSSQFPKRDLRLNQAPAGVDRSQYLLLPRLRFPHRDFIAETKLEGLPLTLQAFRGHHWHRSEEHTSELQSRQY